MTLADRLHIAILRTRGIPGHYSGFETLAEELSARLVERGHEVTIYCHTRNGGKRPKSHLGVQLVYLPAIRNKYAEIFSARTERPTMRQSPTRHFQPPLPAPADEAGWSLTR